MRRLHVRGLRSALPLAAASLLLAGGRGEAAAQGGVAGDPAGGVFVNSEAESYLRLLQVTGHAASYPWSIRSLSATEVERLLPADSAHPWAARMRRDTGAAGEGRLQWIAPRSRLVFNSAFPYGRNDGPVWAGRGLTASVEAGVALRLGVLSVTLAPHAMVAQNADFAFASNGRSGPQGSGDLLYPGLMDRPRRFGDGAFVRLSPGQSTARIDVGAAAVGVSTANQHWGPAVEFPLVLGNNAGGFPHMFVGTSRPVGIGVGRLHGRVVWGRLSQSDYTDVPPDSAVRFASGAVLVFTPRGADGLELGVSRFFHVNRELGEVGSADLLRPFGRVLKGATGDPEREAVNQVASAFARWVFPRSGLEVYGEYLREDHSGTFRDVVLEPDHISAYTVGLRKVWEGTAGWTVLRGEVLDARITHLRQVRSQAPFYIHTQVRQGHTHGGQLLGSPAAFGGAGAVLALDRYGSGGRVTVALARLQEAERFTLRGGEVDVSHAVSADGVLFRGRFDVAVGATGVLRLNREFGDDAFNLNTTLGIRTRL